jgi:hypothetical protein
MIRAMVIEKQYIICNRYVEQLNLREQVCERLVKGLVQEVLKEI